MATLEFDLSLRLRHPNADLTPVIQRLGLTANRQWIKGDLRRTPKGDLLAGVHDSSYCSVQLSKNVSDLGGGLTECLRIIAPAQKEIKELPASGGTASIAIGWVCDGDTGLTLSREIIAELAQLGLTVDIYLYFAAPSDTDG